MEFLRKCLDDVDDLVATLGQQFRPVLATVLLCVVFVCAVAAFLLLAPNDLLAAP
jgi:hypothetical protein